MFVVRMDPRSIRVNAAPVVEWAGLVEPFQQVPVVEVDQRAVDPGLRQPAEDPLARSSADTTGPSSSARQVIARAIRCSWRSGPGSSRCARDETYPDRRCPASR